MIYFIPYRNIEQYKNDLISLVDLLLARLLINEQSDKPILRHFGLPITLDHIVQVLTDEKQSFNASGSFEWRAEILEHKHNIDRRVMLTDKH